MKARGLLRVSFANILNVCLFPFGLETIWFPKTPPPSVQQMLLSSLKVFFPFDKMQCCRGPAQAGVHGFHTGNGARGDSIGDGWRMKDTDSSSGVITPTLFWGRLSLYTFFFRL